MSAPRLLPSLALGLAGCLSLRPEAPEVQLYALEAATGAAVASGPGPLLAVGEPRSAPGFDGAGMVYLRRPHEPRLYARSAWVDAPARMIAPVLVQALERTRRFSAVITVPGVGRPGLRLDSQILRLQHEFLERPSRVRFAVRVELSDPVARRVLGVREVEAVEEAPSEDAHGGVVAANRAVRRALDEVAAWCAELASGG